MIDGRPAVFVSCSERFREGVADRLKTALMELGLYAVIVTEEQRLPSRAWEPESKVESYLLSCDAFVALVTPDEELADGRFRCKPNVVDEVARALGRLYRKP